MTKLLQSYSLSVFKALKNFPLTNNIIEEHSKKECNKLGCLICFLLHQQTEKSNSKKQQMAFGDLKLSKDNIVECIISDNAFKSIFDLEISEYRLCDCKFEQKPVIRLAKLIVNFFFLNLENYC